MIMSSRLKKAALTLLLIGAFVFGGAAAASAQTPYEPNDDAATAFGPLFNLQSYSASLETENDEDYYYFYVTTPATSQVTIQVNYVSGGDGELYMEVMDSDQYWQGDDGTDQGDPMAVSVSLGPGKYYLRIDGDLGANYTISTSGTEGSFSDYTPIATACASATESLNAANVLLSAAALRLKAATKKVIRTRHRSRYAKKKARRAKASAKRAFNIANDGVKAAVEGQRPWCFIPQ